MDSISHIVTAWRRFYSIDVASAGAPMFVLLFFQLHTTITYSYAIYQSMHGSFTSDVMQVCIKYVSLFGLTFSWLACFACQ